MIVPSGPEQSRARLIEDNEIPPLPEGWDVQRLRFLFMESKERNGETPVGDMLSVSEYHGVVPKEYEHEEQKRTDEELRAYRVVRPGQLAVNTMWLNHLGLGVSNHLGHVSPAYAVYDISPELDQRFAHHLFRSQYYLKIYLRYLYGIRPNSFQIKADDWNSIPVIVPPKATQKAIADFLDRETARIGQLIQKKQEFVSGVEEEFLDRTTLLVTAGLDRSATTKSSGHEWQPTVPSHWTVTRLKFLCERIVDCLHETPEHIEDGEYPSIRTSDVIRGAVKVEAAKRVSAREYQHRIQRLEPREGDILYTREGERFGLAALVPPSTKLCLGQRMMMFRANKRVFNSYLMWSLNGKFAYNLLKQDVTGATSPHLNIFDIRNVPIFLPPLDEQKKISSVLDEYFSKKEDLVAKTALTIGGLKEYQAALITAAVTGQIDVATWATKGSTDRRLEQIEEDMVLREVRA